MCINTHTYIHTAILRFFHNLTIRGIEDLHPGNPMSLHKGDYTLDCEWMITFKSQHKNDWRATNYWHCRHYTPPYSVQVSLRAEIRYMSHCTPPHSSFLDCQQRTHLLVTFNWCHLVSLSSSNKGLIVNICNIQYYCTLPNQYRLNM